MRMRCLDASQPNFEDDLKQLISWDNNDDLSIVASVEKIIKDVRKRGDAALFSFTKQFDHWDITSSNCFVTKAVMQNAWESLPKQQADALQFAADRIRDYAEHQLLKSWSFTDSIGNTLGQKITALDSVGVYVPGGKAAYPSSVLMNILPAKVAGVSHVTMVSPTPNGEDNQMVLAAAWLAGADNLLRVGGAQAVAALAYGTNSIPAVDKIVGPGNIYVATAKKLVFGQVGIDMVAGPSEILILCDGKTQSDWIAMDLFSQAEHDENAQSILISPNQRFLDDVQCSIDKLIDNMERKSIILASLEKRGAFIKVANIQQGIEVANKIAPEHLELSVEEPQYWAEKVKHAGAIFLGRYTPEALGDYCAGPNHVLPTSGTARFSSPLGVYDFQKRTSIIACSKEGAAQLAIPASVLAEGEALTAHARSADYRKLD
ncbi:MAG: histidinol dehydrogenase [Piscirickettsiaceae bacterium]|nr:MAG: histidinol dehydrogenase [Piscirickettsiaceae bacterium]